MKQYAMPNATQITKNSENNIEVVMSKHEVKTSSVHGSCPTTPSSSQMWGTSHIILQ